MVTIGDEQGLCCLVTLAKFDFEVANPPILSQRPFELLKQQGVGRFSGGQ